tara:strand:+ start:75 stop:560 length:486 start_codon:yes stop_codon:yes gene_type:complete
MFALRRTAAAAAARRVAAPPPALAATARGFKMKGKDAEDNSKQAKKGKGGGSDPYGAIKQAILAEPDAALSEGLAGESTEASKLRRKQTSRALMNEHMLIMGGLSQMIKLRDAAKAALPEALRVEADAPDLTSFPLQRRVFTETAPIPGFQQKLRRTDRGR